MPPVGSIKKIRGPEPPPEPINNPAGLPAVPHRRPRHRLLSHHLCRFGAVVVAVDPQENERLVFHLLRQISLLWDHGHAGATPGGPKDDRDDLPSVVA